MAGDRISSKTAKDTAVAWTVPSAHSAKVPNVVSKRPNTTLSLQHAVPNSRLFI